MQAEPASLDSKLNVPPELLDALKRHGKKPRNDFRLEGWPRRSFVGRFIDRLFGRSA
jgi:hypothetical protein